MPVASYDPYAPANPWWQQQQAPSQQGAQFAQPPAPQRPKQWYEGLPTAKPGQFANSSGQSANSPDEANSAKQPSLYDMMLNLGRMTPADYNKRVQGTGPAAQVSPWAWLGSMFGGPSTGPR